MKKGFSSDLVSLGTYQMRSNVSPIKSCIIDAFQVPYMRRCICQDVDLIYSLPYIFNMASIILLNLFAPSGSLSTCKHIYVILFT